MMNRETLLTILSSYQSEYANEVAFIPRFLNLLQDQDAFLRTHLPGHMTGSAWIVNESCSHVLLTHHAKLNRWLQPGGHADGDEDIFRVAMREAEEETGLKKLRPLTNDIFDIDIHPIPERNGFPLHEHFDIRVVLLANSSERFIISEESHDLAWVPLEEVARKSQHNESMIRMVQKTKLLVKTQS